MDDDTHVIENQEPNDNSGRESSRKANPLLLGGVVLAVLLLFVGVALSQRNRQGQVNNDAMLSEDEQMVVEDTQVADEYIYEDETANTNPAGTSEETMIPNEDSEATDANLLQVEGGNFYFKPNTITVNSGEKVKITFTNVDGMHDFVIDELNIKTPVVNGGETAEVEFTAEEPGEYEFYCSVGSHRQMGMKGTLIVN